MKDTRSRYLGYNNIFSNNFYSSTNNIPFNKEEKVGVVSTWDTKSS